MLISLIFAFLALAVAAIVLGAREDRKKNGENPDNTKK